MTDEVYRDPTPEELKDPLWNAIWEVIKTWDVNVPKEYGGYCGATGNHVCVIFDAIKSHDALLVAAAMEKFKPLVAECNQRYEVFGNGDTKAETYLVAAAYAWLGSELESAISTASQNLLADALRQARLEEALFIRNNRLDLDAHISDLRAVIPPAPAAEAEK